MSEPLPLSRASAGSIDSEDLLSPDAMLRPDSVDESGDTDPAGPKASQLRKSIFGRKLGSGKPSSSPSSPVLPDVVVPVREPVAKSGRDWKNLLGKRMGATLAGLGATPMPSEADVLAQFDAFIYQRGLDAERSKLEELPLEDKWTMIVDGMAESKDASKQRHKMTLKKGDAANILRKLAADLSPGTTEAFRVYVTSEFDLNKFLEANGIPAVLSALAACEGKSRKTAADQEMLLDLVMSVRALIQHPQILQNLIETGGPLVLVGCFDPTCEMSIRSSAVNLLRIFALVGPVGVGKVTEAWNTYCKTRLERGRFEHLVQLFTTSDDYSVQLLVAGMAMALLSGTAEQKTRIAIRHDLMHVGFKTVLAELAENEAVPEETRGKFAIHLEEFKRQQQADGSVLVQSRDARSRSSSNAPGLMVASGDALLDDEMTLTIGGPSDSDPINGLAKSIRHSTDKRLSTNRMANVGTSLNVPDIEMEMDLGQLLAARQAELASNPEMAQSMDKILRDVLIHFDRSSDGQWQWECCNRLTRLLVCLPHQLDANFDLDLQEAFSPESQLGNLLLGGVAQDAVMDLREEVYALRQEVASISEAANVTINDLQIELDLARKMGNKLTLRRKKHSKLDLTAPSSSKHSKLDLTAASSSSAGDSPAPSTPTTPRTDTGEVRRRKKKKGATLKSPLGLSDSTDDLKIKHRSAANRSSDPLGEPEIRESELMAPLDVLTRSAAGGERSETPSRKSGSRRKLTKASSMGTRSGSEMSDAVAAAVSPERRSATPEKQVKPSTELAVPSDSPERRRQESLHGGDNDDDASSSGGLTSSED